MAKITRPEPTILIIENSSSDLVHFFQSSGFHVVTAADGLEALKEVYKQNPDIILLSPELLDDPINGSIFCQRLREISQTPLMIISEKQEPSVIISYLELGADDYLVKPIQPELLLALVQARIRQARQQPRFQPQHYDYNDGFLKFDLADRRVIRKDVPVKLSPIEYKLLAILFTNRPSIISYEQLLREVWGEAYIREIDFLRVYIWHLRQKIERDPKNPTYLINEQGVGYQFQNGSQ